MYSNQENQNGSGKNPVDDNFDFYRFGIPGKCDSVLEMKTLFALLKNSTKWKISQDALLNKKLLTKVT